MGSRISNHRVSGEMGRADRADWGNVIRAWGGGHIFFFLLIPDIGSLKQGAHGIFVTGFFDLPPPGSLRTEG